jgi:hypothetical protein
MTSTSIEGWFSMFENFEEGCMNDDITGKGSYRHSYKKMFFIDKFDCNITEDNCQQVYLYRY